MQLQGEIGKFDAAGLGVVLITYDSPQLQQAFIEKHGIGYPVLSDVGAQTVQALGILNEEYAPGDSAYGIPHPGVFVVAPDNTIVGKVFVKAFAERVSADGVLAAATEALALHDG